MIEKMDNYTQICVKVCGKNSMGLVDGGKEEKTTKRGPADLVFILGNTSLGKVSPFSMRLREREREVRGSI